MGSHVHTDSEIKLMITESLREELFSLFSKPRSSVQEFVESLIPIAAAQKYTREDVQRIVKPVPVDEKGRMDFNALQKVISVSQRRRLKDMVQRAQHGKPIAPPVERPIRVPYQSKAASTLMEVTRRTKLNSLEEEVNTCKRLHSYSTLVSTLEDQSQTTQVRANVLIVRTPGDVNDRWDRYCATRRVGRSSYVKARNTSRYNLSMDDGLGDKHPGCSMLVTASAGGSSAAALLGAS